MSARPTRVTLEFKVDRAIKRRRALEARLAGHTYDEIARVCGYKTPKAAQLAISMAIKDICHEPAKLVVELEKGRLDKLWNAVYPLVVKKKKFGPSKVSMGAARVALAIMERRSALMGLDAPKRTESSVSMPEPTRHVVNVVMAQHDDDGDESE